MPTLLVAAEVVRLQGAYVALTILHDFVARPLTLSPSLGLGLAAYRSYPGADESAPPHVNNVTGTLAARIDLTSRIYLTGRVSASLRGTPEVSLWRDPSRKTGFVSVAVGYAR